MIKTRSVVSRFLAVASILLCVVSTTNAQDKVLLRMNLHLGQTFDESSVIESEASSKMPKMSMDITMTMRSGFHKEVLDVDKDGNIKLKATFQKSTTDVNGEVAGKPIPSEKNDYNGFFPLGNFTGQSIVETMTPQGEVIKVEGMDAIIQRVISATKDPKQRARLQGMVTQDSKSSYIFSSGIGRFPEAAIAVGDSWTSMVSLPMDMLPQVLMKYTLISSKDGVATIAMRADFSPNPQISAGKTSPLPKKTDVSGTESGVMLVDEKTGLTISSEVHTQMKIVGVPTRATESKVDPAISSPITAYVKGVARTWIDKLPQ